MYRCLGLDLMKSSFRTLRDEYSGVKKAAEADENARNIFDTDGDGHSKRSTKKEKNDPK